MKLFCLLSLLLHCSIAMGTPNPVPPPPPPGYPPSDPDYLYQPVNHYVPSEDMIDLRQELRIDGRFYGRRIEFVVVRARALSGPGQLTLMVNSHRSGPTQRLDPFSRDLYFRPELPEDELDIEARLLKLYVRGQMEIEGLGVKFASGGGYPPPPPPPPPPMMETGYVHTNFIGMGVVELGRYVDLMRYQGYRLSAVYVRASGLQVPPIPGELRFCTDRGCSAPVQVNPGSREQRFYPRGEFVDWSSRSWRIETKGAVAFDSFTLQFSYR